MGKKNQVKGSKNWGTILLNYPIIEGTFYCEVEILDPDFPLPFEGKYEPHVRVGIGPRDINFDRPLGSQQSSFSYRDKDGSFINDSNLKTYGQSYGKGDVIGILVHMFPPLPNFENY
jgi:COMPASS component BRE2